jgi:hypothetical protein
MPVKTGIQGWRRRENNQILDSGVRRNDEEAFGLVFFILNVLKTAVPASLR